jgi:hypothetical protein
MFYTLAPHRQNLAQSNLVTQLLACFVEPLEKSHAKTMQKGCQNTHVSLVLTKVTTLKVKSMVLGFLGLTSLDTQHDTALWIGN